MAHDVRSEDVPKISARELFNQIKLLLFEPFNPEFQKFNAIYVIGKRGTGKTEITRQVVRQMNDDDKDIHYILVEQKLNNYYDASDFIGHSFVDIKRKEMISAYPALLRETEKQLEEYILQTEKIDPVQKERLLGELKEIQKEEDKQKRAKRLSDFCKENKFCVTYFLDEVSAVPPQIIEPIARFVREGKIGDCIVPYGYKVVLAGNYSEEMGDLDYKHPLMLMDRITILYYEPTLEEFLTYFKKSPHSHPAVVAFLTHYPEFFLQYENQFSTSPRRVENVAIQLSKLEQFARQNIKHSDYNDLVKNLVIGNFPSQIANSFYTFYITVYNKALQFVELIAEEFSKGTIIGEDLSSLSDEKIKEMALSLLFYLKKEQFNLSIERLPLYIGAVIGMYYLIGQLYERNLTAGIKEMIASLTSCVMTLRGNVGELVDIMQKFEQNSFEKALEKHIDKTLSEGKSVSYKEIQKLYLSMEKEGREFFELLNKAQSLEPGTILFLSSALSKVIESVKETCIESLRFKDYVEKGYSIFYSEAEKMINEIVPSSSTNLEKSQFDLDNINKNKTVKKKEK